MRDGAEGAVEFPDEDRIHAALGRVVHEPPPGRSASKIGGAGAINVLASDLPPLRPAELAQRLKLRLRLLLLVVGAHPCINRDPHVKRCPFLTGVLEDHYTCATWGSSIRARHGKLQSMTTRDYAAMGRAGARSLNRTLSAAERSKSAERAARARWKKTSKRARQEAARKAVLARWARYRSQQS